MTLQLLWAEYVARHGERAYRYSRFCGRYREWRARQKRSLRQQHRAGEKAFIDYCGPTVPIVDRHTGEIRDAQVFVGVLGASSYTYAEATHTQSLPDWIASHQRMLRFFGGVPELLVPDNLKAAVTRACRYAPKIRPPIPSWRPTMAPPCCRPALQAQGQANAEVAVQVVERWILARLRHRTFFSLAELNAAIAELLPALNERPFQGRTESRKDLFEALDRPALKPLPQDDYAYAEWRKAKPGIDYHIEVDKRFYSVPHALVGQVLELRITATTVEVMHKGKRVASTPGMAGGSPPSPSTCPSPTRPDRDWSPGRFLNWAADIGPCTAQVVKQQLEDRPHPEHGYRACLGQGRRYDRRPGEGLRAGPGDPLGQLPGVASILKQGLDRLPPGDRRCCPGRTPLHGNVRGAGYYH